MLVEGLICDYCDKNTIHTSESRAKAPSSFERKCQKLNESGGIKYPNPLKEITDLAGVRIIVFTRDAVDHVCKKIGEILDIVEAEDVGERVYSQGKFGYQSKHLLVQLGTDRRDLFENKIVKDFLCEVQVRTILQHAWAAMEHDIQYKSEVAIPADLNKRFSALAGLLEIADREFERIQNDSANLRKAVQNELISDLTQQTLREQAAQKDDGNIEFGQSTAARDLVRLGKYGEAIDLYTQKIRKEPNSTTLYLGRAKARFLAGDRQGSLSDLSDAEDLGALRSSVFRLRSLIESGADANALITPTDLNGRASIDTTKASEALAAGDGITAFEEFLLLESQGYNRAFAEFGKSMSCALERDTAGAKNFMQHLVVIPETPMSVNICALNCVIDILNSVDYNESEKELLHSMAFMPRYSLDLSPMKPLWEGLFKKNYAENGDLLKIYAILRAEAVSEE